jgi:spermidine/putrescine transport system substrate-binding protein
VPRNTQNPITRRRFISRAGSLAFAGSAISALSACGDVKGTASKPTATPAAANHPKVALDAIEFSNWPLYIDRKVIRDFNRRFDAKLHYVEDINDNNEFFGKVRQELEQGRPTGRDLVALTDWMAARWIRLGYLEPIDKRNIPNVEANMIDGLRRPVFDRDRKFTAPWQSGITGLGYNRKEVGELRSMEQLFDPKYKGRVSFLSDARDSASLVMLMDGVKPEEAGLDEVMAAIDRIDEANGAGQIRRFTGNDYTTDLTKGNVVIAMAYAADLIQLKADNPNLDFAVPEQGAVRWSDNMMIPAKAEHPYGAEVWMNYVYEPEVAARITAYVGSISPVDGIQDLVAKKAPELAENPLVFPDAETQSRLSGYPDLSPADERQMNERFAEVTGG